MTYDFFRRMYDTYCRRPDGAPPYDGLSTQEAHVPPFSDGNSVLDDDWNVSDLNDVSSERVDQQEVLEHSWSYGEPASKARLRYVKDIIEVARRGFLESREFRSSRREIISLEEEVVRVTPELRYAEAREKRLQSVVTVKTEPAAEKSREVF